MSQLLVAIINNTSTGISVWNAESSANTAEIAPGQIMVVQGTHGHWNIPDCSDNKYFAEHHIEIRASDQGAAILSIWDNDDDNYILEACSGTDYDHRFIVSGASNNGNNTNVALEITGIDSEGSSAYQIAAILANVVRS